MISRVACEISRTLIVELVLRQTCRFSGQFQICGMFTGKMKSTIKLKPMRPKIKSWNCIIIWIAYGYLCCFISLEDE